MTGDVEAVWEFARQFARTSGDSPACECVSCRACRAVQERDATPTPGHLAGTNRTEEADCG